MQPNHGVSNMDRIPTAAKYLERSKYYQGVSTDTQILQHRRFRVQVPVKVGGA